MSKLLVTFSVILVALTATSIRAQECLVDFFPITEADLLEPGDRWPDMEELQDSVRGDLLRTLGYVDTTGTPLERMDVHLVFGCELDSMRSLKAYYLDGNVDEHDDYVYLASYRNGAMVDRILVAQLQTTCASTYLLASTMLPNGTMQMGHLEHRFNCETQEFVETVTLAPYAMVLRPDGTFNETEVKNE